MFHVELRQFPHVARAFNLNQAELDARILKPWLAGAPIEYSDRRWAPDRARLKIYEAPELRADQLGLGRGWAEVTRSGEDVTAELLTRTSASEQSTRERLRGEVLKRLGGAPLTLAEITVLAGEREVAERVVLELLREGRVRVVGD